ncbi:hypothetical protein Bpfe_028936 [Biomphalaria pfeifferi]|uniref:Uncharacterized protein n=1 Tax=Biomphalaria pfeifferi TaxID=112525 RepID=A0AAD8ASM9_BIOPF|nr:hypothetical protein Bpfe_028936 [Biomphalaria pfeifferi]
MVSQAKGGKDSLVQEQLPVDSLVKEQLPVDSLVKEQLPVDSLVKEQLPVDSLVKKLHKQWSAEPASPINGCAEENSARHYLFVCQTTTSSSQQQPGQLEKEKAAPEESSADGFAGNTLPAVCDSHRSTST